MVSGREGWRGSSGIHWAANNGVAFDHGKTEAAIFRRRKTPPAAVVKASTNTTPFNKEAMRWLGVGWTPSSRSRTITLSGRRTGRTRWHGLAGSQGRPANCRKAMTACAQSVAMFGSELW